MSLRRLVALTSVVAAVGCNLDTNDRLPPGPPRVRFVNAAPGSTNAMAHLNQAPESVTPGGLAFREITPNCLLIINADHQISFVEGGTTLASTTALLRRDNAYLVALVKSGTTYRAVALAHDQVVAEGNTGMHFINATSAAGDIHVTTPTGTPSTSSVVAGNVAPLAATLATAPYVTRPEAEIRIRLYDAGSTSADRADLTLANVGLARLTTVIFTDRTFTGDPGAMQVNACP